MKDLNKLFSVPNVATLLGEEQLNEIGGRAVEGYETDDRSREEWKKRNDAGMKLAMQIAEKKDFPFENASNVMYPLISIAALQFASRAYPNLVPGWDIVKTKVVGKDESGEKADKAQRAATYMNYQLNEQMCDWEEETDRLLTVIPIMGCCFKETYYSTVLRRNVSSYYSPKDIVMHYMAKSMETVPRLTKNYTLYENEIIERIRGGMFLNFDVGEAQETRDGDEYETADAFKPHVFLQQCTWLDLDEDGYKEPYVINVRKDDKRVVRIVPRFRASDIEWNDQRQVKKITPYNIYTKFSFLPSPDGSIYDWGFGGLLGPINHSVNTAINQIFDAGTRANTHGGFISKKISLTRGNSGGNLEMKPNEWVPVGHSGDDLRRNIVPAREFFGEPSVVLFNLLGFMQQAGERLSSVTELLMGEQSVQNEPATTSLARIEQGLKVFSSIHKRLHRAFGKEFKILFRLNADYMDPETYFYVLDDPIAKQAARTDFDRDSCDVAPVSDPNDVSNTQKLVKAQLLYSLKGQGFNDGEISRRFLEALQIPDVEKLLDAPPPPPDPKIELERWKFEFDVAKYAMEQAKIYSEIIKNIAEAEAKEAGPQLEEYKLQAQAFLKMSDNYMRQSQKNANNQG